MANDPIKCSGEVTPVCDIATGESYFVHSLYDKVLDSWEFTRTDNNDVVVPGVDFEDCPDVELQRYCWRATVNGNGFTVGDNIEELRALNAELIPPAVRTTQWVNTTTGMTIAAPSLNDLSEVECGSRRQPIIGYLEYCDVYENVLALNAAAAFSDSANPTTSITMADPRQTVNIVKELRRAQEFEQAQIAAGLPVTNFIITTVQTGSVFEFPPSAWIGGNTLEFTTADLVSWPGALNDRIDTLQYSVFDNCVCEPVEMKQDFVGNDLLLQQIYRPDRFDPVTRAKERVPIPLPFGVIGPRPGPCPPAPQVSKIDNLCCNDDLENNSPEVAAQRLAWLDGDDSGVMLDAVGGTPIAGNDGDQVFEVQDKLAPGVAPSFVVPTATPPGDAAPINPPTYQGDVINGRSILRFNSANRERLRLDSGNPPGAGFTLFYLMSATDQVLQPNACILAVGPDNADGENLDGVEGTWQLSRDQAEPSFILRWQMNAAEYALGVDPPMIVQTGPFSDELGPANPGANPVIERAIAEEAEFFNGQIHLITMVFDDVANTMSAYFDGDLRMQMDLAAFPASMAGIGSDYFRVMGNRGGNAFLSGDLAEMFFADSAMSVDDISAVNAYLICKWGVDPSLVAGGSGVLELAPDGSYNAPSPFRRILTADGDVNFLNSANGLTLPLPHVPGLSVCPDRDACCENPGLTFIDTPLGIGDDITIPSNTAHTVGVLVETGTADINGVTWGAGGFRNALGDEGQNNVANEHVIDNVTGTTIVTVARY